MADALGTDHRYKILRGLAFRFPSRFRVVWLALAALVLLCLVSQPATLGSFSMLSVTQLAGVLLIATIGQGVVVCQGSIDLSSGAMMTLAAALVVHISNGANTNLVVAVVLALLAGVASGLVNGILVALFKLNAVIVTLATSGILVGVLLQGIGVTFSASGRVPDLLSTLTHRHLGPISVLWIVALVLSIVVARILLNSRAGRRYVMIGANPVAARIVGVRVRAGQIGGFAVAGLCYAAAGVVLAGLLHTPDTTLGGTYQLTTIVAVALSGAALTGGPSSLLAMVASTFFLSLLDQYLAIAGYSGGVRQIVQGGVLVLAGSAVAALARFRLWRLRHLKNSGGPIVDRPDRAAGAATSANEGSAR